MTLAVQVYWNYKNYEAGRVELIRDVQVSLDQAVDQYYEDIATKTTSDLIRLGDKGGRFLGKRVDTLSPTHWITNSGITEITITDDGKDDQASKRKIDSLMTRFPNNEYSRTLFEEDSSKKNTIAWKFSGSNKTSIDSFFNKLKKRRSTPGDSTFFGLQSYKDSFPENSQKRRFSELNKLTSKIVVSFSNDTLDVKKLDSIVLEKLRAINIDRKAHSLSYSPKGDTLQRRIPGLPANINPKHDLYVYASSKLLPTESILSLGFNDITSLILKRNLVGILLSFLLMAAVISSLFYLLKIIKEQKQLAEIKNDFISNITHEFKTPIATISAAIEGIQHFNKENDKEKTEKYLDMSTRQLGKLNMMVERILDMATLDKEDLSLQKSKYNLVKTLENLTIKYKEIAPDTPIYFIPGGETIWAHVDIFHLENAIDNLVDNATKYGKPPVEIAINSHDENIVVTVKDSGSSLTKDQAAQLFEKFYRVPKGNTHDVKGFGIGLYYTKTIIEKHDGTITLSTSPQTTFKITIPHGN